MINLNNLDQISSDTVSLLNQTINRWSKNRKWEINQSIKRALTCPVLAVQLHMHGERQLIGWLTGNRNCRNSVSFDFSGRKLFLLYAERWKEHFDIKIFKNGWEEGSKSRLPMKNFTDSWIICHVFPHAVLWFCHFSNPIGQIPRKRPDKTLTLDRIGIPAHRDPFPCSMSFSRCVPKTSRPSSWTLITVFP